MIWTIRYFFITAGTGGLRYELCFRSFKLTEQTAKFGHEICIAQGTWVQMMVIFPDKNGYKTGRPLPDFTEAVDIISS
jgi:hypothetical protein